MIPKKVNKISKKKNILVVPLDWGLGHATRCIPLIKEFEANGCGVIIAAEKATESLLKHEFQHLTFIALKGYRISYSRKRYWLPLKIISQIPRILLGIYKEHKWLKKVLKKYSINAVIADNRFGLYHSGIPSIYITHQLLIKTGSYFSERIAQKIHFWFIKKYTSCWVPDFEGMENISGELSHPSKRVHLKLSLAGGGTSQGTPPWPLSTPATPTKGERQFGMHTSKLPSNINYIGCLSRFEKKDGFEKKYDLLIILSGPEPQRTIFEEMLLMQLQNYNGKSLLVRGLPGIEENEEQVFHAIAQVSHLIIKNHLSAGELNEAILQSKVVISRSGYTTIMDLIKLKQKAILVPTPGQTEQEYLASHLMKQRFFYTTSQEGFVLPQALKQANDFPFAIPSFDMDQYKKAVFQFVQSL